ncbi:hypothetical protein [Campylobacter sp.]|uniref:hypothetical protein n=1 Tax=Campylobacter sp. TaxID=205 RepID=UPI0026DC6A52|nr:hypothetical protein [Campylobacter sp.]MDO4674677.1 hypothetical protein [Campylobacter sp.]
MPFLVEFLEERGIFIRDYSHLIPGACRITIGTREEMQIVAHHMRKFVAEQGRI